MTRIWSIHVALRRTCATVGFALFVTTAAQPVAATEPLTDAATYDHYCARCHEIGLGARNGPGPPLNGIIGTPAGNMPGFAYSTALRRSAIVWTPKTLGNFIENPRGTVPGNHMNVPGIGTQADRDAIVRYLSRFERTGKTKDGQD